MCLIFLHHNNDALSKYKLIVAANRDEEMSRPTKPADFHPKYPHVLCGIDMRKGVEGGTWMGVTKGGRFSALTNVLVQKPDMSKLPRGELVINYLGGSEEPLAYMEKIQKQNFRPCNLLAGRVDADGKISIGYYCTETSEEPVLLEQETNVLACSLINCNWRKVQHGRNLFVDILHKEAHADPETLTEALFNSLLSDTTSLYPDEEIFNVGSHTLNDNTELLKRYCSIKIAGDGLYGTRMQTVLLIGQDNCVYFTEKTLSSSGMWSTKSYEFKIEH